LVTQPEHVSGRFNEHLVALLLLHSDEGFWAGDHRAEGVIKSMITAETMAIEGKFKGIVSVDNYVRLLVTGNPDWLVPAGLEERRFAVLDVGDAHRGDHAYFGAIEKQMNEGGREALLDHLLGFDLSSVNLRQIPKTAALLDQKIASLSPEMSWLLDFLRAGQLPWGENGGDYRQCKAELIFDSYIEHAKRQGVNRRAIETTLGMYLRKVFPTIPSPLPKVTIGGKRVPMYRFPPLAECRRRFAEDFGQSLDHLWGDDAQEDWDTEDEPTESYPIGKRW
jgi:hypothetical protein